MTPNPAPPPARRRWLNLSLRGLMVLVVLIAVPVGWVARTIQTQRQAVAAVKAAGGQVTFDYQSRQVGVNKQGRPTYRQEPDAPALLRRWLGDELFQHVQAVSFFKPVTPEVFAAVARFDRLESLKLNAASVGDGLRALRGLRQLRHIALAGPGVTDSLLADMAQIASLRALSVGHTQRISRRGLPANQSPATDAGFAHLANLPDLENLTIVNCPELTDAGMARLVARLPPLTAWTATGLAAWSATLPALARHHPNLEYLGLDFSGVTDDDLKAVEGMTKLKSITMQRARITDAGLAHLRRLSNLTSLGINVPGVTDAGLKHLTRLTRLRQLILSGSQVGDAGLDHLTGLPITELFLNLTRISDAGMDRLARISSLRRLMISHNPGITDAGLIPLRTLANLQELDVSATKVTPEGVVALRQALPTLKRVTNQPARPTSPAPAPSP